MIVTSKRVDDVPVDSASAFAVPKVSSSVANPVSKTLCSANT